MINTEGLKKQIDDIDALVASGVITPEKGDTWKARVISEFEATEIPKERRKELPNDLAHLPGRMVGGFVDVMAAFTKGCGATYEGLSKQEGYLDKDGRQVKQKQKSVVDLYDDLPPMFK